MRTFAGLSISLVLLLAACTQSPTVTPPTAAQPASTMEVLGVLELPIDSSLRGQTISTDTISGISVTKGQSARYEDEFYRYISTEYIIRNTSALPRSNVTFLAVGTDTTIPGSPYKAFRDENGNTLPSTIAAAARPIHGLINARTPNTSVTGASFQVYDENEVAHLNGMRGIINAFPWGYVATRADGGRTLTAAGSSSATSTATFTLSTRVPKASGAASGVLSMVVVTDNEIRTTRDLLERHQDLDGSATSNRASTLSVANGNAPVIVSVLPNDLASFNCAACTTVNVMNARTMGLSTAATTRILDPSPLTRVALKGEDAGGNGYYNTFGSTVLNEAGQVAFTSTLSGGSAMSGLFLKTPESPSALPVVLAGQEAPSTNGAQFSTFGSAPTLNEAGQLVFAATLSNSSDGIFAAVPGSVQAVAYEGQSAPGAGNSTFNVINTANPMLSNSAGQVAFYASLTGGTTSSGIFLGLPGAVTPVALQGQVAPGGGTYTMTASPGMALNGNGEVAFNTTLNSNATTIRGLFLKTADGIQLVARQGGSAPTGGTFGSLSTTPALNDVGQVAFQAPLAGTTATQGIFMGIAGNVQTLVRSGEPAPGTNSTFGTLNAPLLNGNGQVAFLASLSGGTSTQGIFLGVPGSIRPVAVQGAPAPDAPGLTFGPFGTAVALNAMGLVAFTSTLSNNVSALYVGTPDNLRLVTRRGDQIDTDPSREIELLKTISNVTLIGGSGGQDGRAAGLNGSGLITYRVTFTDASQAVYTLQ